MGFIIAAAIVVWATMAFGAVCIAIEINGWIGWPIFAIIVMLGLGFVFQVAIEENRKGPCVQYETQMHYNAATKRMMPARVCVLRGEWVD